jgi:hypothetical protein
MRYCKFKTKLVFTLGIYYLVWRFKTARDLRDDFHLPLDPVKEFWLGFVPVYNTIRWWRILTQIRDLQARLGMAAPLSRARAFWLSSLWFAAGPYMNRHLNALYTFRDGQAAGFVASPMSAPIPSPQPSAMPIPGKRQAV